MMKTIRTIRLVSVTLFSALLFCLFCANASAQSGRNANDVEITFSVPIDCPSCQQKLEAKLPFEKGVKDLKISLDNQTVWFRYDKSKTNKEALVKAIEKLGYEAVEVETD